MRREGTRPRTAGMRRGGVPEGTHLRRMGLGGRPDQPSGVEKNRWVVVTTEESLWGDGWNFDNVEKKLEFEMY